MIRSLLMPICLFSAALLTGCEKPTVDVSLHGVNYTADTFSYRVMDPMNPKQGSGGELIDPFGAGGTMCCATLPRKWHPDIKLEVRTTHWPKSRPEGTLPEVKEVHSVDVPPYMDGKPGELWVLREADGKVSVISSDVQPDHPKWPGKVKGWPVPSREYQLERWEFLKKLELDDVNLFKNVLSELERSPKTRAIKAWRFSQGDDPSSLKRFSGPDDPKYIAALREEYLEGLKYSEERLKSITEMRP